MTETITQFKSLYPPVCVYGEYSKKWYVITDGKWNEVGRKYDWSELSALWIRLNQDVIDYNRKQKDVIYEAQGSNGNVYKVKTNGQQWSCSCPAHGFGRGKDCKHILKIKKELAN